MDSVTAALAATSPFVTCKCSFVATGTKRTWQLWAHCYDCFKELTEGACERCIQTCHVGHRVGKIQKGNFFCDCGAVYNCNAEKLAENAAKGKLAGPIPEGDDDDDDDDDDDYYDDDDINDVDFAKKIQEGVPEFLKFFNHLRTIQYPCKTFYESNTFVAQQLISAIGTNFFFSPLSIRYAMTMVQRGAAENTSKQIAEFFGYSDMVADIDDVVKKFNTDVVRLACAIVVRNDIKLKKRYANNVQKYALISNEDFGNRTAVVEKVNSYISTNTNGDSKNMIKEDMITLDTIIILLSTLYFKAEWRHKFPTELTQKDNFTKSDKSICQVDMMRHTEYFPYYEDDAVQIVELPYTGGEICMGVILPKGADDINLRKYLWNTELYEQQYVRVHLPKFTQRKSLDLIPPMKKCGVVDLFESSCRLDSMVDLPAHVSILIHDAVIEVTEHGTEASAATVFFMIKESCCMPPPPKIFHANRRFIFYIKHMSTNALLFVGDHDGI